MKKVMLLFGTVIILFAFNNSNKDIYLQYTNKVINYEFNLPLLNKIKNPFYETLKYSSNINNAPMSEVKKRVKITLISVFGNSAYIKIDEYLGEQLTKSYKKWIKLDNKIFDCKLVKLTQTDAIFKCKNRVIHKTINQKIPMIRDKK